MCVRNNHKITAVVVIYWNTVDNSHRQQHKRLL